MRERFPELLGASETTALVLTEYFEKAPHRFFSAPARREYADWIADSARRTHVAAAIHAESARLDRAFRTLGEINAHDWHDALLGNELERLSLLDRFVHPTYLRLLESVLHPFLLPAASTSRRLRGVSTDGLNLFNVVQELESRGLPTVCSVYDGVVRNAIAHGAVDYRDCCVVYSDAKATREMSTQEVVRLVDDLVDVCNGVALAIKMFLFTAGLSPHEWPREVLLQELQAAAAAPWWVIEACLISQSIKRSQLNIYATARTHDRRKMLYSAMQSAVLAERLATGHDRYFVSIQSSGHAGWAAFDGLKLTELRQQGAVRLEDYAPAIEEETGLYLPGRDLPSLFSFADTMGLAWRLNWREASLTVRAAARQPIMAIRHLSCHTDPLLVQKAWVVVSNSTVSSIRLNARWIMNCVARKVRAEHRLLALRPVGVSIVTVFARDYRRRRLVSFGLAGDLVCTLSRYRDIRKKIIDIHGSRVEKCAGIRIAWNANWAGLGDHLALR